MQFHKYRWLASYTSIELLNKDLQCVGQIPPKLSTYNPMNGSFGTVEGSGIFIPEKANVARSTPRKQQNLNLSVSPKQLIGVGKRLGGRAEGFS